MGKTTRLISLDYELNEKLKKSEVNASGLVNDLLNSHFNAEQSNDIEVLSRKAEEYDLKIQKLTLSRDSIVSRIRILNEKSEKYKLEQQAKKSIQNTDKKRSNFLGDFVKDKTITFDQYLYIKAIHDWQDYVDKVATGQMNIKELVALAEQNNKSKLEDKK